jgi:glycosyltransferase involved in cell wall biosynthesis
MRIVVIVHYFPPINSAGSKRFEAISKYLAKAGHQVTVITTGKRLRDGVFTETMPPGIRLVELGALGLKRPSAPIGAAQEHRYSLKPSWRRRVRDWVFDKCGQLPDPRLPFAIGFALPTLAGEAKEALKHAQVVIGSQPPWPMLLAAVAVKIRFGVPCVLDYRDHFSECHEMPGGVVAKRIESVVDRWLASRADLLVTISEPMATYYADMSKCVVTIRNGYDPDIFASARAYAQINVTTKVVIRYMGNVSPGRVPHRFLAALVQLKDAAPDVFDQITVEFYGHASLVEDAIARDHSVLEATFRFFEAVPYAESIRKMVEADYLLYCETSSTDTLSAQGILATKLLEYIGSGRPVIADISATSLSGMVLAKCGTNHIVGNTVETHLSAFLSEEFLRRREGEFTEEARALSRREQALEYSRLLEKVARV